MLKHLDTTLEWENPGASEVLLDQGVALTDVAFALSATVPNGISVGLNPSDSRAHLQASMHDITNAIHQALTNPAPKHIPTDPEERATAQAAWLESRGPPPDPAHMHSAIGGGGGLAARPHKRIFASMRFNPQGPSK